jgi:hypothetical protein
MERIENEDELNSLTILNFISKSNTNHLLKIPCIIQKYNAFYNIKRVSFTTHNPNGV